MILQHKFCRQKVHRAFAFVLNKIIQYLRVLKYEVILVHVIVILILLIIIILLTTFLIAK